MKKKCPICGKEVDENISGLCQDAEAWIIEAIRRQHPDWVREDGSCAKCLQHYRKTGPAGCR